MRRSQAQTLGAVIEEYLNALKKKNKYDEARIINQWREIVGPVFADATEKVYIREGVLHAQINSPAVRNELLMAREILKKMINKRAGFDMIKDIVVR